MSVRCCHLVDQYSKPHRLRNRFFSLKKKFFFNVFIYFWKRERERDRAWAEEEPRERETQNLKQAPGSELSGQSLMWSSNSGTVRSWPEPISRVRRLTNWATQEPVSDSWFPLRWSQVYGIKPHIGLFAECGACLRFSLSVPPVHSLSQINKHLKINKKN